NAEVAEFAEKSLLCALCGLCVRLFVVGAVLLTPAIASAHPVPFTYLDLRLQPDGVIDGSLVAHMFDLGHDLNIDPAERLLDPALASQQAAAIARLFAGRLTVSADGRVLTPQWSSVEVLADRQSLKLSLRYTPASRPGVLTVSAAMFPYDPNHQTFLN